MTRPAIPLDQASRLLFNVPVVRLASRLAAIMQRDVLAPHGLKTAEWRLLFNLRTGGDQHLRQLARNASNDASYVSRLMTQLEKAGLVGRYADPKDGRRTLFTVTAKGDAVFEEIWPRAEALSDEFRSLFGVRELEQFESILERSIAHADRLLEIGPDMQAETAAE